MRNHVFHAVNALRAIAKRLTVLMVSVVMLFNLTQTAAMAAPSSDTESQLEASDVTKPMDEASYSAAKEDRRQWQRKVSAIKEEQDNAPTTLREKLNVDELSKGYDPEREAEKRAVPTP